MGTSYLLYKLSMLYDPQAEYDLAPGSSIVFVMQSISLRLSRKILFEPFMHRLMESMYFRENFPYNRAVTSELQFPNHIYVIPVSGSEFSALGLNVFGGILSEISYFNVIADSKVLQAQGADSTVYDQASRTYTNIIQRMKNRFSDHGKIPGLLFLDSAAHYPGDFLSRKIEEAKINPTIYVFNYAIWETRGAENYSGERFLVELGDGGNRSRIIASQDLARVDSRVIEVPVEYRVDFERDIDMASAGLCRSGSRSHTCFHAIP